MGTQLLPKKGRISLHNTAMSIAAGWIKMALGIEVGLGPGHIA